MMRKFAAAVVVLGIFAGPGAGAALADFSISVDPVELGEGDATGFTVTVTRTVGLGQVLSPANVTIATGALPAPAQQDTASADDYALPAEGMTLSWGTGQGGAMTRQIRPTQDSIDEDDELLTFRLTNESEQVNGRSLQQVKIVDDDLPPTLTIGDASVVEGTGAGPTVLGFPLTLSAASARDITANYATSAGTATAGQDYTEKSGQVFIPKGATSGTIHVNIAADDVIESNETLTMTLTPTAPANVAIAPPGTATGTITNDDTLPTLSISGPGPTAEGSSDLTTAFPFVIALSKPSPTPITVAYSTADGSASAPSDYEATEQSVVFAAGETSKTVTVPVRADTVEEPNEDFSVTLSDTGTLTATVGGASATIVDDDGAHAPAKPAAKGPAPTTSPRDEKPPRVKLSKLTLSKGALRVTVSCPADERVCRGTLTVFSVPARKSTVKALRSETKLVSSLFVLQGGQRARLTLRPSKRVSRLLRQARTVRARGYAVARDGAGNIGTARTTGTLRSGGKAGR